MANIPRAPFYVPRPSDDAYWSGTPAKSPIVAFLTRQKIFGAGGQVPTKQWGPIYTFDDQASYQEFIWVNHTAQLVLTEAKFFGRNGQAPTKNWNSIYIQDDASVWNATPIDSTILAFLTKQKVFGVGGQVPAKQWRYDYDDASSWQFKAPHNGTLSVVLFPFITNFWKYNIDDASTWNASSTDSAIIQLLTAQKFYGVGGQASTKQRRYDIDDAAAWQFLVPNNSAIRVVAPTPIIPKLQRFDYDDAVAWQFLSPHNSNLSISLSPFTPTFWRYNLDDSSIWSGTPTKDELLFPLLTAAGQVKSKPWLFGYDDPSYWSGQPFAVSSIQVQLTYLGKVPTKQWHYDIDDAAVWWDWTNKNITISTAVNKPLTLPAQQFVISAEEPWTLTTQRNLQTDSIVLPPFKSRQYKLDIDDASIWYNWINRNLAGLAVAPSPINSRQARFDIDDNATWQWQSQKSIAPTSLTIRAKLSFINFYDDASVWSGSFKSVAMTVTQPVPLLNHPKWNYGLPDDQFWRPTFQTIVNKFLPLASSFPFVSGRWHLEIPQDAPTTLSSHSAALLYIPLLLFKRIANAILETRSAVAPKENRTANAPPENRAPKVPPGDI